MILKMNHDESYEVVVCSGDEGDALRTVGAELDALRAVPAEAKRTTLLVLPPSPGREEASRRAHSIEPIEPHGPDPS
jgi:hypothetical protein